MKAGTTVKNLVIIQSDDRECGIDDGTPIIQVGTTGVVLGNSKDFLTGEMCLKPGNENSVVVEFDTPDGKHNFDVLPNVEVVVI